MVLRDTDRRISRYWLFLPFILISGLGACNAEREQKCEKLINQSYLNKANKSVEAFIRLNEGEQALGAVKNTYTLKEAKSCQDNFILEYGLRQDLNEAYVGADRIYRVEAESGEVTDLSAGD